MILSILMWTIGIIALLLICGAALVVVALGGDDPFSDGSY